MGQPVPLRDKKAHELRAQLILKENYYEPVSGSHSDNRNSDRIVSTRNPITHATKPHRAMLAMARCDELLLSLLGEK